MNYRHGFHAGNFADLAKHAATLSYLRALRAGARPLKVVDTHAGAGFYDLSDETFSRSKEAEAGIKYLLGQDVPPSLKALSDYVWAKNRQSGFNTRIGIYPGSPTLIMDNLPAGGDYVGCELRPDDYELLKDRIAARGGKALYADGYDTVIGMAESPKDLFVLIDPPFEKFEDYERINETLAAVLAVKPDTKALVWLPLKDLETLDRFLRHMECALLEDQTGHAPVIDVAELRLRPLTNPLKMNGCALVGINTPPEVLADIEAIAQDVTTVFGETGGKAQVWRLD
ncbi:23S rRNA (adenine(2030)-N(6))-methyltransferase RlmJ [Asticcacaulis sp. YBE204]|uniref:23S rRNA (adenine(2030)-N(6))-methyltransferase RlmJ n=1 Tax=Asticcacaulis sp. YBE204 TaxID=1282363 RepID=UPI0003C3E6BB|nr:23S rRNA (adenine(2030)-N(6))-methyltransferase RlmJ [Asticcacaulis sp. YBE204]ESQ78059.1 hypothetical protein AEYBE204_16320 [Asticcacaulis sp. YBE204]